MPPRKKQPDAGANSAADLLSMMKLEPVPDTLPELPAQTAADENLIKKATKTVAKKASLPELPEPVPEADPSNNHYVGFLHQIGARKEEIPIRVWSSNDIASDRKQWSEGVPQGLKTHRALHCKKGNADEVVAAFIKMYKAKQMKSPEWFTVSKKAVEEFSDSFAKNADYELVTEAKAKFKAPKLQQIIPVITPVSR